MQALLGGKSKARRRARANAADGVALPAAGSASPYAQALADTGVSTQAASRYQALADQLAMAGAALKVYYAVKAKERQLAGLKRGDSPVKANLPDPIANAGQARDAAARKVGRIRKER